MLLITSKCSKFHSDRESAMDCSLVHVGSSSEVWDVYYGVLMTLLAFRLMAAMCMPPRGWLKMNTCQRAMKTLASKKTSLIEETRQALIEKRSTAVEITQRYLDRIQETEPSIHSFVTVDREQALQDAEAIDKRFSAGESIGSLAGVPIAVKVGTILLILSQLG